MSRYCRGNQASTSKAKILEEIGGLDLRYQVEWNQPAASGQRR